MEEKEREARRANFLRRELESMIEWKRKIESGVCTMEDLPIGYIPDFSPRAGFLQRGLSCPYEHCIELMPLKYCEISCPVWGHDCPGGQSQLMVCRFGT